jgi:hypothetical protein
VRPFGRIALIVAVCGGAPWSSVLGASFFVRPWSLVLGPGQGPGTKDQGRTTDQERTKPQAPSTKDHPWFATWQQVPPARKWFDPWAYQKVTLRIDPYDDGLRVVYDMVRRRGGITHMEWSGRFDGRDYPVHGVDYVLTNAYRQLSDRSYEIVVRVDGREAAVATAMISADGSTMSVETVEKDARGQKRRTTAVYKRR